MLGLAFSGGKDSWACLWLNQHRLDEILVIWVNTGKNYPEALEMIEKARAMCPNWLEVKVDRDAQNAREGIPSDIVPIDWTPVGQLLTHAKPVTIQPYLNCCYENLGMELVKAAKEHGITHLIKGQRNDEGHLSPSRDGMEADGITYVQPLDGWTEEEVREYLKGKMEIPPHFAFKHTSLDCYDCTAFRRESKDRVEWMRNTHPDLYAKYDERAAQLYNAIAEALN